MRSFVDWSFAYYDQVIKVAKLKGVGRLATKEPSTSEDVPLQLHHKMLPDLTQATWLYFVTLDTIHRMA